MFDFMKNNGAYTNSFSDERKSGSSNFENGDLGGGYHVQDYESYERFADDCGQHFKNNKECEDFWNKFW